MDTPNAKTHLTFGGSTAHRWLACPGSVQLCATLPPQIENEHMAAGTRAHAVLEVSLSNRLGTIQDVDAPTLAPDEIEAVQVALDYVNRLLDSEPGTAFWVELFSTLADDVGGSADVVVYVPSTRTLHVIDYKHGRGRYVSENTPQTKFYATCVLFAQILVGPVDRVNATVIQPRCAAGEPIRTAVYSPADLIDFSLEIEDAVRAARAPGAPLIPGETQCHWCPAAAHCPALCAMASVVVDVANSGRDLDERATVLSLPAPEAMRRDPAKLAETVALLPILQNWIDAVGEQAKSLAIAGVVLPGFKLVQKRAMRKWANEDAVEHLMASQLIDPAEYMPRKLVSPVQADMLAKKWTNEQKLKLAALAVKESSGVNLVPEHAPGEAVNPSQMLTAGVALPDAI